MRKEKLKRFKSYENCIGKNEASERKKEEKRQLESVGVKSIHEKWAEGEITILPPRKALTERKTKNKLRAPDLSDEKRDELLEVLWKDIEIKDQMGDEEI